MKIKPRGKIYSLNEGYCAQFDEPLKKYLESIKYPPVRSGKKIDHGDIFPHSLLC